MSDFNAQTGTFIDVATARSMASNYRSSNQNGTKSIFFGKDKIQAILDQEGCIGINFYLAHENDKSGNPQVTLVLVGMDAQENDQITQNILDVGARCPLKCPSGTVLQ